MGSNLNTLQTQLETAVKVVIDGMGCNDFRDHWLGSRISVWEYLRTGTKTNVPGWDGQLDFQTLAKLDRPPEKYITTVGHLLHQEWAPLTDRECQEFGRLLHGMAHGTLATLLLLQGHWKVGDPLPEEFQRHADAALSAYDQTWPLLQHPVQLQSDRYRNPDSQHRLKAAPKGTSSARMPKSATVVRI